LSVVKPIGKVVLPNGGNKKDRNQNENARESQPFCERPVHPGVIAQYSVNNKKTERSGILFRPE
jgi:hypothetical protein